MLAYITAYRLFNLRQIQILVCFFLFTVKRKPARDMQGDIISVGFERLLRFIPVSLRWHAVGNLTYFNSPVFELN